MTYNRTLLSSFILFAALSAPTTDAFALEPSPEVTKKAATAADDNRPARFIVQLDQPSLIEFRLAQQQLLQRYQNDPASAPSNAPTSEQQLQQLVAQHNVTLQQQQQQTLNAIRASVANAEGLYQYRSTVNSVAVSIPVGKLSATERREKIRALKRQLSKQPGVERVFEDKRHITNMHATKDFLKVPEAWQLLSGEERSGEGVRVAVIDTGINPNHPMFQDNGHAPPADRPGDDYCATTDPDFCNDKLIVARYFNSSGVSPGEVDTPYDVNGHGSHVAGTAVGNHATLVFNGLPIESSGMAPGAYLMVYKGLHGVNGGSGNSSDLLAALEAAYLDGADIINNSWGSGAYAQEMSPFYESVTNLEAAGVVVVNSAGNDGRSAGGVGCPSCIEAGLSVASSNSPGGLSFNTDSINGSGFDSFNMTPAIALEADWERPIFEEGVHSTASLCESLSEDESLIAEDRFIIINGVDTCEYTVKITNAETAGAAAVIIYGLPFEQAVSIHPEFQLPVIAGVIEGEIEDILAAIDYPEEGDENATAPTARLTRPELWQPEHGGLEMSGFSSRGPVKSGYYLKPDITAPGGGILSAAPDENGSAVTMSGTSMAAPHIAGLAALLKQGRPELTAKELKSLLVSTAEPILQEYDGSVAQTISQGAGSVNIVGALKGEAGFTAVTNMQPACPIGCTVEASLKNLSDQEQEFVLSLENPTAIVHRFANNRETQSVTLAPGESTTINISLDTTSQEQGLFDLRIHAHAADNTLMASLPVMVAVSADNTDNVISNRLVSEAANSGEPFTVATKAEYFGASGESELRIAIPDGATLVADSVVVDDSGQVGDVVATTEDMITWRGTLPVNEPNISLAPGSFSYQRQSILDHIDQPYEVDCEQTCDDFGYLYDLSDIGGLTFNGDVYESIMISDNGYLTMGPGEVRYLRATLPNEDYPGNMIAPLWHDYVVKNDAAIYVGVVDDRYFVVEWHNMPLYGRETTATFAVWYSLNDESFFFNYVDLSPQFVNDSGFLLAATQDRLGLFGRSVYSWDTDFAAAGAFSGRFEGVPASYVEVEYELRADAEVAVADISRDIEQGETITVDLAGALDISNESLTLLSEVYSVEEGSHRLLAARNQVPVNLGSAINASVDNNPEHGVIDLQGTLLTYQPDIFHYGTDSLRFTLSGDALAEDLTASLQFNIDKVFAEPQVAVAEQATGKSGEAMTIAVEASDPYGHPLTYGWSQLDGEALELEGADSAEVSFTPPLTIEDREYQLQVTVANEEYSVTREVTVFVEKADYIEPVVLVTVTNDEDGRNEPGDRVRLSASESYDELGLPLTFRWTQTAGPNVSLSGNTTATASFSVPNGIETATSVSFEVVADNGGLTSSKSVSVRLQPAPESSSSVGFWMLLLGLPLVWLRRRKL